MQTSGPGQLIEIIAICGDVEDCEEQILGNILRSGNLEIPVRHPVEM